MGAKSARIFERGDAGRLIDVSPVQAARVDMRHAERPSALRIKIGVEHAAASAELQLEARSLADLQRWHSEMTDELVRGEAAKLASGTRRFDNWRRGRGRRLLWRAHTGSERQREREGEIATHIRTMPGDRRRGNVARR